MVVGAGRCMNQVRLGRARSRRGPHVSHRDFSWSGTGGDVSVLFCTAEVGDERLEVAPVPVSVSLLYYKQSTCTPHPPPPPHYHASHMSPGLTALTSAANVAPGDSSRDGEDTTRPCCKRISRPPCLHRVGDWQRSPRPGPRYWWSSQSPCMHWLTQTSPASPSTAGNPRSQSLRFERSSAGPPQTHLQLSFLAIASTPRFFFSIQF
jgi:hypothetical protein